MDGPRLQLCGQRHHQHAGGWCAATCRGGMKIIFDGVCRSASERYQPAASVGGDRVRQRQPAEHAAAGPGPGRGFGRAGVSGHLPVAEYTALQMKKAIVGHGLANKSQIQEMVMRLLKLPGLPGPDAADALGLAITHAHVARQHGCPCRRRPPPCSPRPTGATAPRAQPLRCAAAVRAGSAVAERLASAQNQKFAYRRPEHAAEDPPCQKCPASPPCTSATADLRAPPAAPARWWPGAGTKKITERPQCPAA